jgi:elongation factor G
VSRNGADDAPSQSPLPERIRNVALVGHTGAGKSTLIEALLAHTGAVSRPGRIDQGTLTTDHEPIEARLGRSVSLAVASTQAADVVINLIDTPGHPDFVGELRAGLRAADAALFVVSAVGGVDPATRLLWQECVAVGLPRAVVITQLDQPRGDFTEALAACRAAFGEGIQPVYLPVRDGDRIGLYGLLTQTVSRPDGTTQDGSAELTEANAEARSELIEGIIQESEDDTLLDRWLEGEHVGVDVLIADLERAVAQGSFHPVLPVLAPDGVGLAALTELIVSGLPSPLEHPLPPMTTPEGDERKPVECDPDGPLVAEVIKTMSDQYVGQISIVRIFSGRLAADDVVHVSGHLSRFVPEGHSFRDHDENDRAGAVSRVLGAKLRPMARAGAGDIVAVARLSRAVTGDTLSDVQSPTLAQPWSMPDPLLPSALTVVSSADDDKLAQALSRISGEDPAARVSLVPETHQIVLWSMGELHRDVMLERLAERHGVAVNLEPVRVALRETVVKPVAGRGRHVKQSGGHGQYAICEIEVEPLPMGGGFEFVDRVVGGAVPRQFIASVEKGLRSQMARGIVSGYPVVDLRVTLVGGKAHSVDSSDAAFQAAGALALREAAAAAGVAMLEPVDALVVIVDDEYVGAVMGDLSSRRGRVTGTSAAGGGRTQISAEVPALELLSYVPTLRSLAHGSGSFTRVYQRHAPMPPGLAGISERH